MSEVTVDIAQCLVAMLVIGAMPWAVVSALRTAVRPATWRAPAAADQDVTPREPAGGWTYAAVLGAVAVGALLRLVVEPELAMIFIGYKQTEHAIALVPVSHYGVGASALYHAVFALLPLDHRTIMGVNAALGVGTIAVFGTWVRLRLDDRVGGAAAAWLCATSPIIVRNDLSEANHVPALAVLFVGLVLLERRERSRLDLPFAAAALVLATISRPEFGAIALVLAAPPLVSRWRSSRAERAVIGACGAVAILAIVPHFAHVLGAADWLLDAGGLDPLGGPAVTLSMVLIRHDILLKPELTPVAVVACALLGLVCSGRRWRTAASLALAVLVALIVTAPDVDGANRARVQVPAYFLTAALAALTIARLHELVRLPAARAVLLCVAAGAFGLSMRPSAAWLFRPTNEATEDRLVRRAADALEGEPPGWTLVRLGVDEHRHDDALRRTHMHFPDYLFRPPENPGVVVSVRDFARDPSFRAAWFFHGIRCYARARPMGGPPPDGDDLHEACARMHREFALEPVFEQTVPNHGDVWFEFYPSAATLQVGLYRVVGRRDPAGSTAAASAAAPEVAPAPLSPAGAPPAPDSGEGRPSGAGPAAANDGSGVSDSRPMRIRECFAPGREAQLLAILGGREPLADGCVLEGVDIGRYVAALRYRCDSGDRRVSLAPPAELPANADLVRTGRFALAGERAADRPLVDALAARIRLGEAEWSWLTLEVPVESDPGNLSESVDRPPPRVVRWINSPAAFALGCAGTALGWLAAAALARRRRLR